jgi:hypothetical protein
MKIMWFGTRFASSVATSGRPLKWMPICFVRRRVTKMPRWTPVTERLPSEEYDEYKERWQDDELPAFLVMVKDAVVSHMLYFDGENWCRDMRGNLFPRPVTHWMPMPEPPTKEDVK